MKSCPIVICLSGLDGSGKSLLTTTLSAKPIFAQKTLYLVWMRYGPFFRRLANFLARYTYLSKKRWGDSNYTHYYYKSKVFSSIYCIFIFCDYILSLFWLSLKYTVLNIFSSNPVVIIIDRFMIDIISDLYAETRLECVLSPTILQIFFFCSSICPLDMYFFVIKRPLHLIYHSRPEHINDVGFQLRMIAFNKIFSRLPAITEIYNERSPEYAVNLILNVIV